MIPEGCNVSSRRIQYVSRCFLSLSDQWGFDSMTQRSIESNVWESWLKCSATGDLLNLLSFQSDLWMLIRRFSVSFVSPTYCFLQTLHVIKYMALLDLQVCSPLIADLAPTMLVNTVAGRMSRHVWQRGALHGFEEPAVVWSPSDVNLACTRISWRDLGLRWAIIGFSLKIVLSFLKTQLSASVYQLSDGCSVDWGGM